jgi:hypothetical protein
MTFVMVFQEYRLRRRCASLSIGCERFSERALTPWLVDVGKQGPQHCSKDQHVHEDTNGLPALKAIEEAASACSSFS